MDFGVIEGQPISDIGNHLKRLHTAWKGGDTGYSLEDGESPDTVLKRVLKRSDMLIEKYRGEDMLFVLHGRLIRILLSHWLGYGLRQMHRVQHQNGALYHLRLSEDNEMEAVFLNKTEHLKESGEVRE
jgi:probable phosphoglycerate mutase